MTADTEYSPDDLLDEDGNVDPSKVKSIAKKGKRTTDRVSREDCRQWRQEIDEGLTPRKAIDTVDPAVVRYHATGQCTHDHDAPPVEYDSDADEWGAVE
jgi:hypothetical protein